MAVFILAHCQNFQYPCLITMLQKSWLATNPSTIKVSNFTSVTSERNCVDHSLHTLQNMKEVPILQKRISLKSFVIITDKLLILFVHVQEYTICNMVIQSEQLNWIFHIWQINWDMQAMTTVRATTKGGKLWRSPQCLLLTMASSLSLIGHPSSALLIKRTTDSTQWLMLEVNFQRYLLHVYLQLEKRFFQREQAGNVYTLQKQETIIVCYKIQQFCIKKIYSAIKETGILCMQLNNLHIFFYSSRFGQG